MMGEAQQIVGEYRVVELRKDCATKICIVVCNQQIWVGRTHKGGGRRICSARSEEILHCHD